MAQTISSIPGGPQTKSDFGIFSAAKSLIQDTLTRGRSSIKNIVNGTKNSIVNLFK